jgi:type VI secretion system protein ImpB
MQAACPFLQETIEMGSSIHDKLKRVRKPRVHITYEVETEGAVEEKELPFVVGVMGDFSGHPTAKLKSLKDRKFVNIDRDNINDVMQQMKPGLNLRVNNTLQDDGSEMPVQLKFESMEDFEPANVAKQVKPLNELLEARDRLRDLLTKVDLSEDLEGVLAQVLGNTEQLAKLAQELGVGSGSAEGGNEPAGSADDAEGGE